MTPKLSLVLMTGVAVVSDSLLHPFYPQYFASVFGITEPLSVGLYVAACSLTVLLSLPLWAALSKRVPVLRLLVVTQSAAAVLALACSVSTSLPIFCALSIALMATKASYLLIYPYLMSQEEPDQHIHTIGLLAFVVYFGNILAALVSGVVFELLAPRSLFTFMALGDLLQTALCVYLATRKQAGPVPRPAVTLAGASGAPRALVYRLGLVMTVLYFSAYLTEPFFSEYWLTVARSTSWILTGAVFAVPGLAALLALYVNSRLPGPARARPAVVLAIAIAVGGLLLQASGYAVLVLVGRFLYGWALFQAMVRLDLVLFRWSTPDDYAVDFSRINLFQGLGVMLASPAAGFLVRSFGGASPFLVSIVGFVVGLSLFVVLFREEPTKDASLELAASHQGGVVTS